MTTDPNSLLIFAQVVESNSFSQAALRLHVPISTVSRRVSDLEKRLGVRLIERSTRRLRLTNAGSEVFEHAQRTFDISNAVINIASNHLTRVSGTIRVSAPSTLESVLAPVMCRFQALYPDVRVQVFVTERVMNQIEEGIDLAFRVGPLENSSLVVRHLLCYRHQLVASPAYLKEHGTPKRPKDLLQHRLTAFAFGTPQNTWSFSRSGGLAESILFQPHLSTNDYSELASLLVTGAGIGELPPIVQPELLRDGRLVEVLPRWHLQPVSLSIVHFGNRYISRSVRLFKELAIDMVPRLFPTLPR
ncbi:MAG: LysR family transcriptional regulator [Acidobacteriaceae bacterium]|nr:LysR family transcriptional regulator [Acidobacteriaceae bacterium]